VRRSQCALESGHKKGVKLVPIDKGINKYMDMDIDMDMYRYECRYKYIHSFSRDRFGYVNIFFPFARRSRCTLESRLTALKLVHLRFK